MAKVERKRFVTTINPEILLNFKVACTKQNKDMNEILTPCILQSIIISMVI